MTVRSSFLRSGLVHLFVPAALVALGPMAWAAPKTSPPSGGSRDCGWTVTRDYLAETMSYRLHLELGGCGWWDGSPRELVVDLVRDDGSGKPERRASPVACSSRSGGTQPPSATSCEAVATLDHPENETDVEYRGTATWKWNDGRHRVAFDSSCTTTSETIACTDGTGR
jgi:hypothetical protein